MLSYKLELQQSTEFILPDGSPMEEHFLVQS